MGILDRLFGRRKPTQGSARYAGTQPPLNSTSSVGAPPSASRTIQSQQSRASSPPPPLIAAGEKELKAFADILKRNGTSFVKLNEMGVREADTDPKRSAVCFLVALDLKPGDTLALSNLEWVTKKGVIVDEIRAACGFSAKSELAPTSFPFPTLGSPPTMTEENKRRAQALWQQAHQGILGSPTQRELYLKALGVDPNLRLAWSELSLVAAAAGDYDLADKCNDATRVFNAGKFLKDFRDVLGHRSSREQPRPNQTATATQPAKSRLEPQWPPDPSQSVHRDSLGNLLASLEAELRSSGKLPMRRLRVKQELGADVIGWSGGVETSAAEQFLAPRLAAIGIRLSGSAVHTEDDDGSVLAFWRFGKVPTPSSDPREEAEVERLLALSGEAAKAEAGKLAQEERFDVLALWMRASRYVAIPFNVLRETQNPKAAQPLIALLGDPDSDIRGRAAGALGPLGGEQAAQALCSILSKAEGDELLQIGWALKRLEWNGAVNPLMTRLERTTDRHGMTSLVGALQKCGAEDRAFGVLIRRLSQGDDLACQSVAALNDLKNPCATLEVKALLQRTSNQDLIRIARMYLQTHHAV